MRLEALQGDWRECEEDIEEILTWLKSIRQMLNADIPDTYDDLQADLTRCKVRQLVVSCLVVSFLSLSADLTRCMVRQLVVS